MTDASYISYHASNVRNNILGKLRVILDIDRTIPGPTLENLMGNSLHARTSL